ncbi:MAG: hypothetical protein COT74_03090 [Bdellovibrionales bacterium CG10_big_fil_rev_8_21_14_0_10_45_34]|nr:MAG: hypothetical protein COT74_03090 [Bdellovibrionales bacterium CG10_big_fil_rev_8_21_14_0_10_45_34]
MGSASAKRLSSEDMTPDHQEPKSFGHVLVSNIQGVTVFKLPPRIDADVLASLAQGFDEVIQHPTPLVVFDFARVQVINILSYRDFVVFAQKMKKQGGGVASINLSAEINRQIDKEGLESVFNPTSTLNKALLNAGLIKNTPAIDVKFINPFIKAVLKTLGLQANTVIDIGTPRIRSESEPLQVDIAGVLNITSHAFHGTLAICFTKKVFLGVYANMFGETKNEITPEMEDAVGELLNIIFGSAKAELNDYQHYSIQKAIPTVVKGSQLNVHHSSSLNSVLIPFTTDFGEFFLDICVPT